MSVHQLKGGRWIVKIYDPSKPSKLRREYFGRGASAELEARERDKSLELKQTKPRTVESSEVLFHEIAMEYMLNKDFNKHSQAFYLSELQKNIIPELGHIAAIRLTYADLDPDISRNDQSSLNQIL